MINAIFTVKGGYVLGYEIRGHSDFSEQGSDIVCSAVSSAAYMTANTITEVQHLNAEITVNDGFMKLNLSQQDAKTAEVILNGFLLHLNALKEEYKEFIKVKISEV